MHETTTAGPTSPASRLAALRDMLERTLAGLGYELVDLERVGRGLLRVTMDRVPGPGEAGGVRIDDCERVSRHLTHLLAVEGVEYDRLEVSSPGLDRPLRGERDFARFAGEMAAVQLVAPIEGRRRLRGRLLGLVAAAEGGQAPRVRMTLVPPAAPAPARGARRGRPKDVELETVEFALADVEKARLAPEWEFDRQAAGRSAPGQPKEALTMGLKR